MRQNDYEYLTEKFSEWIHSASREEESINYKRFEQVREMIMQWKEEDGGGKIEYGYGGTANNGFPLYYCWGTDKKETEEAWHRMTMNRANGGEENVKRKEAELKKIMEAYNNKKVEE